MSNFFNKSGMKNNGNDKESSSKADGLWDDKEAHFSGHPPPTPAPDRASRRPSQILPPLVKPTAVAADSKKKAQLGALPQLVQWRHKRRHLYHALGLDTLPKGSIGQKPKKGAAVHVRREPDTTTPLYPELADEQFSFLWEKKGQRGKTLKETLETVDEKEVPNTILASFHQPLQHPSAADQKTAGLEKCKLFHEQIRLYRYYGLKLRNAMRRDVILDQLRMLLRLAMKPEANREGIGEAFNMAAFCHLEDIIAALRDFSGLLDAWKSIASQASKEELDDIERQMRGTLMLCYGQAASGAKAEDLLQMVGLMVSEVLSQFRAKNKDEELKRTFMRAIIMIASAIVRTGKDDAEFPLKSETAVCITGIIKEEPLGSVAINNLHQALIAISSMTCLKPPLEPEVRSELMRTAIQKVFSLPFFRVARGKAQAQEHFQQTIGACQRMLSSLLLECPSLASLQEILRHTKDWIESPKTHERQRALRSTSCLLGCISEKESFDVSKPT